MWLLVHHRSWFVHMHPRSETFHLLPNLQPHTQRQQYSFQKMLQRYSGDHTTWYCRPLSPFRDPAEWRRCHSPGRRIAIRRQSSPPPCRRSAAWWRSRSFSLISLDDAQHLPQVAFQQAHGTSSIEAGVLTRWWPLFGTKAEPGLTPERISR